MIALSEGTSDFWVEAQVPRISHCSSLEFFKRAYSKYHPVILTDIIDDWPALTKWTPEYLSSTTGDKPVSINLTADGRADSVQTHHFPTADDAAKEYFVYPAETKMTLKQFFELSFCRDQHMIAYLSQQNDNLRTEFSELLNDINIDLEIARDVFDSPEPEAVNLWIGDERSVSSVHKDHYENFYAVISGEKTFTLLPPTDIAFFPERTYPTLRYAASCIAEEERRLELTSEGCPSEELSWISLDPDDPLATIMHPPFAYTHPLRCHLRAGEVLYIPAMWYHRVSQTRLTIAVNMWYDMRFDYRYVFCNAIQQLCKGAQSMMVEDAVTEEEYEEK